MPPVSCSCRHRASAKALKLYIAYAHIMCYTAREGFVMNEKILASPYREQNTLLEKANQTMEDFYLVEEERKMYFAACKYESDRISMINASERKGIAKGIRTGIERGSYQKALETARLMKCEKLDNALIAKVTGLSEAQVEQL